MKSTQNQYSMDGSFECDGEIIYYKIIDDTRPIIKVQGVERMSRYISFYKESGEPIETISVYDTYEIMTNISHFDVKEWYQKHKNR